nr:hypothetical protein [Cressdnaviricota sp.]
MEPIKKPFNMDNYFKKLHAKKKPIDNTILMDDHLLSCETGFSRVSLDETKNPAGTSPLRDDEIKDKLFSDYSFSDVSNIWDISSVFFCTFTYSSTACFSKKEEDVRTCKCPPQKFNPIDPEDVLFVGGKIVMPQSWYKEEILPCKCKLGERYRLIPFWDMSFDDQYLIFRKHFTKWRNAMNRIMESYAKISGYEVFIEKTEKGILHAHAKVYSKCSYKEGFGQNSSAIWANIAHGKVSAMQKAFEPVRNSSGLNRYLRKSQNNII